MVQVLAMSTGQELLLVEDLISLIPRMEDAQQAMLGGVGTSSGSLAGSVGVTTCVLLSVSWRLRATWFYGMQAFAAVLPTLT